jgi:hypothetical protein
VRRLAIALGLALAVAGAPAASLNGCEHPPELTAAQQDLMLRLAALVKAELARAGSPVAIVSRSGLDLSRIGQRYSHAGLSLRDSDNAPWSVRQLYYACDEARPRLFDQGLPAFVMGTDDARLGYLSLVLLPPEAARPLAGAALDKRQALALLGGRYSANAYPFATRYQNCNQWVAELLAMAWGRPPQAPGEARQAAQQWLRAQAYEPQTIQAGALYGLVLVSPWLHGDDQPPEALQDAAFRVSMPVSLEAFAHRLWPAAQRLEICHAGARVVLHRGWTPVAEGCEPGPDDEVRRLD